ncbi:COP9 signalosome complex subunit, putative [Entamoeba invadens IP1]|uniref:COP9 signalosome complex subunit, putative n=1 Tax=Entamoeba invadens IP1 TaxID=370355 RepID=UPI0002C3F758|nr:COP9 signalosome complex subunit, putative [Entamoeba invadens IP1]ELP94219.1 COP9 signalosome complex subunit, putative [Entamoeba invadens IP1]|eukprot:XP_004260990.1 COP9 signalosome complex subunit, putative [Entamoeba invadens IP1]
MSKEKQKVELNSVLGYPQDVLLSEIKSLAFSPKTFEKYSELLTAYKPNEFPCSHCLILREQTRTLNDKNLQKFMSEVDAYITTVKVENFASAESLFLEMLHKTEVYSQRNGNLITKMSPVIEKLLSRVEYGILSPYHSFQAHILYSTKQYDIGKVLYCTKYKGVAPGMDSFSLQMYLYYVGCIALNNRDLRDALFLFHQCVVCPNKSLTTPALCAWKKATLLSLIVRHTQYNTNGYLAFFVDNYKEATVYITLSEQFSAGVDKLQNVIEMFSPQLKSDGNFGLAKQVLVAAVLNGFDNVSKAFSTIAIDQLAKRVHLTQNELKKFIKAMTEKDLLTITLSQDVVTFKEKPVNDKTITELFQQLVECEAIFGFMKQHIAIKEEEIASAKSAQKAKEVKDKKQTA